MKKLLSPMFRILFVLMLMCTMLAFSTGAVSAGSGAYTDTITWQNVTDTFTAYGSCSDPDGMYQITIVSSGVIHYIENGNGYKFSWEENGTYSIEPIVADSPVTYSGRYSTHLVDAGSFTGGDFVFKNTFTNVGLGSDGTRETFHITTHAVLTPTGVLYEIENVVWNCN